MPKGILAVLLLMAACGSPGEPEATGNTEAVTTSSEQPNTTSTTATSTTTTTVAETTTSAETTTTGGSATSSEPVAGNWADEPLIVTDLGALG
ncbi:MAG: hypothetical protein KY394_04665, partial [Actinobacteria bacterium]|nr:hypothetical protein [Actinomycetota bacterium]